MADDSRYISQIELGWIKDALPALDALGNDGIGLTLDCTVHDINGDVVGKIEYSDAESAYVFKLP